MLYTKKGWYIMQIDIKQKLKESGMTRYELAKRIGVTYPTIDNIYKMLKPNGMLLLTLRSEIDTPTIKLINDKYGYDAKQSSYKEAYHIENTLSLKEVVKILDNRFEFLKLRRTDRVNYILSKENNGISGNDVISLYEIFLEKNNLILLKEGTVKNFV